MGNSNWFRIRNSGGERAEILLYDEIGYDPWFETGTSAKDFVEAVRGLGSITAIDLRINSLGGNLFDGLAIYSYLRSHPARVTVYIDGIAASAASVVAMSGDEIIMPENALMMIHDPLTWLSVSGNIARLREEFERIISALEASKSAIIGAYQARTGIDADALAGYMAAETWLTGPQAVDLGFADKVSAPIQIAASYALSGAPVNLRNHLKRNAISHLEASMPQNQAQPQSRPVVSIEIIQKEYPEIASALRDNAVDSERERVLALLSLAGCVDKEAVSAIADGAAPGDYAIAKLAAQQSRGPAANLYNIASDAQFVPHSATTGPRDGRSESLAEIVAASAADDLRAGY